MTGGEDLAVGEIKGARAQGWRWRKAADIPGNLPNLRYLGARQAKPGTEIDQRAAVIGAVDDVDQQKGRGSPYATAVMPRPSCTQACRAGEQPAQDDDRLHRRR